MKSKFLLAASLLAVLGTSTSVMAGKHKKGDRRKSSSENYYTNTKRNVFCTQVNIDADFNFSVAVAVILKTAGTLAARGLLTPEVQQALADYAKSEAANNPAANEELVSFIEKLSALQNVQPAEANNKHTEL